MAHDVDLMLARLRTTAIFPRSKLAAIARSFFFGASTVPPQNTRSDENFPPLWREAREHHFIRVAEWAFNDHPHNAQADEFLQIAEPTPEDLLVVGVYMDNDRSDPQLRADLHRFLQKIESATGKKPFLYTTGRYWNAHMDDSFGTYPLLLQRVPGVPAVIPRGWSRVSMWLEVKSLPGIDDAFTFTFDGTLEELRALANPNLSRGR